MNINQLVVLVVVVVVVAKGGSATPTLIVVVIAAAGVGIDHAVVGVARLAAASSSRVLVVTVDVVVGIVLSFVRLYVVVGRTDLVVDAVVAVVIIGSRLNVN